MGERFLKWRGKPKWANCRTPSRYSQIAIYDITGGIALAKVSTYKMPEFFDYIQLGKMTGEWKIINVFWAFNG
ncbi:MAG: nuclear transport factor 2 family protein [Saprospiraceae bacterium]|nr:nuclear transport factor 2 family protein [Saprospiraceae bacterium]